MAEANWDMTPYFPSLGGEDYVRFWADFRADVNALAADLVQADSIADERDRWAERLMRLEEIARRQAHLRSYLGCISAADSGDERATGDLARIAALGAVSKKLAVAVRSALRDASDADFDSLCGHPSMADAAFYLGRMRDRARWAMTDDLEALEADLSVTGVSAWGRLYDQLSGKLDFEIELPGEPAKTLPVSMTRTFLEDADPAVRRAAFAGANRSWERVGHVAAASLNAISGTRLALYERRGVEHFLDPACFDASISRRTLDVMMETIRSRRDLTERYHLQKARILGKDRLAFADLMAPLPLESHARVSWEEGRRRVLDAFGRFYPDLHDFAARAFDGRWIDWEARAAKRPGGFCSSSHLIGESRVFMTYNGALGDIATLAHELGHAFHASQMTGLRPWAARSPMTLAETASTFAEQLVIDAVLERDDATREERAAMLDSRLQDASAYLVNIPMRFAFEVDLYTERADGELSVRRLCELMEKAQRTAYGDALDPAKLDPWFWASKLHFHLTDISFYNFPYAFGYLFSLGLFARAKREGPDFLPRYEALLRSTGLGTAESIARDVLGIDLEAPDFWNESIDLIAADLAAFETTVDGMF